MDVVYEIIARVTVPGTTSPLEVLNKVDRAIREVAEGGHICAVGIVGSKVEKVRIASSYIKHEGGS